MPRKKLRAKLWWDTKLSNGKTPKQIVKLLGKEVLLSEGDVERILTRLLILQDKEFFKKGFNYTTSVLVSTYLCCSCWMLGKEPISPWQFSKNCKKNGFNIPHSTLMRYVREAKKAGFFKSAPSAEKLISRYRRRLGHKFHIDDETLDEIQQSTSNGNVMREVEGRSPLSVAAGLVYYHIHKKRSLVTQEQLSEFFGVSTVSMRQFLAEYRQFLI